MKNIFPRWIIATILVYFIINGTAWPEICNRIVAYVNNDVITLYELDNRMTKLAGMQLEEFKAKDPQGYADARRQVLNLLIDEKIAQERIKELGINVTAREIDQAIERIKEDNRWTQEDLFEKLKSQKLSYEEYREGVRTELERMRLINHEVKSKIIVREEEIAEYYKTHQDEFNTPAKVRLSAIFLKDKASRTHEDAKSLNDSARELVSRLKGGEDFGELARVFSQGPGASQGGDLGFFNTAQLDKELQELVTQLPEGGVSDPIVRASGLQIIKVTKKEKGGTKSLEDVRNAIFNLLYKEEVNKRYNTWLGELRKKAYTKIIF
ncbi:MAG: hypothetical protein C4582_11810 [Desulfobacteraceae bacterium]|nr:MAG: hypothetical protein C4582_11810 [Desulfobacteraceae bacterium]